MERKIINMIFISFLLNIFFVNQYFAQSSFIKTYSGFATRGYSIIQTPDSGYAILGSTKDNQAVILRTDKFGDTIWTKKYGDIQQYRDENFSLRRFANGDYILGFGYNLIRTDSDSKVKWEKNFTQHYISNIAITIDTGIVLTGTFTSGNLEYYAFLMKVDSDGDSLWTHNYGYGDLMIWAQSYYVHPLSDSGLILTGFIKTTQNHDIFIVKTNNEGDTLWTKTIDDKSKEEGFSVIETVDKNFFITGRFTEKPCEYCELFPHTWLLKLNSIGDTIWTKKIIFDLDDIPSVGKQTTSGGYIITGTKYTIYSTEHLFVAKHNDFGDTVWVYTNLNNSKGNDVIETNDGGFAVVGELSSNQSLLFIKLDKNGTVTSIDDRIDNAIPENFDLEQNYPNPFNPTTTISYKIAEKGLVSLKVYDVLGKEVAELVNDTQEAGNYKVSFNAVNLSSGVYFYILRVNDFIASKKMIMLK